MKKTSLISIGAAILGLILLIVGISQNNSLEAQLASLFGSGKVNPGTPWIVIGIILILGAAVLFVINKKKNI